MFKQIRNSVSSAVSQPGWAQVLVAALALVLAICAPIGGGGGIV